MTFWDSSALVPLVTDEPTTLWCGALFSQGRAVVWTLASTEIVSGLRRREREGTLDGGQLRTALARLVDLAESWTEVGAVEAVKARAARLLAVHPLRAADALQLGAALVACSEDPRGSRFVSFDVRLREAARREGFDVPPP